MKQTKNRFTWFRQLCSARSKTVTEECRKAVHWELLVNRERNEVGQCGGLL